MTIIYNGYVLDQEIKSLESMIESIDDSSDQYLEAIELLLKLKQKKISNSELAVNGSPYQEALGSWDTSYLMYDSDDHNDKNGLCWKGIPTVRAGKKDKNHAGNSSVLITQERPSPMLTMLNSMKKIYPRLTSGTSLQKDRNKKERKQNNSASSFILINQDKSITSNHAKGGEF